MGQCTSLDEEASWQLSIRRSGVNAEEERLKQLKEEIAEQERKLDSLNSQVARMSLMIEDKDYSGKDLDISYLMETGNFQSIFPSLSQEELSNLFNIIMLINAHSHSLYSERSNPKSEVRSAATNSSHETGASGAILNLGKIDGEPHAEETISTSMSAAKYVTFTERPFGFQVAMPNNFSDEDPILPYVYTVTNKHLKKRGVVAGMALQSVNGEHFKPGTDVEVARQVLREAPLPCTMGFCIPDYLASTGRSRRRRTKKKRKRVMITCTDCKMTMKRKRAKRGLNGKHYCATCNQAHICKYCNFWSAEVDRSRGYIFCDECLVSSDSEKTQSLESGEICDFQRISSPILPTSGGRRASDSRCGKKGREVVGSFEWVDHDDNQREKCDRTELLQSDIYAVQGNFSSDTRI